MASSPIQARDLLAGLNPQQHEAAEKVRGPLCILAGAGSGKTRTVTHRIAHQIATGVARADQVLAVTFTDRAARELRGRLAALGIGAPVRAATFHAAAWAQLRHFWFRFSDTPLPEVLPSKVRLLVPAARRLHVEAADLAAEIEWAKARRVLPDAYEQAAGHRDAPVDTAVMAEVYARYETEKARRNLVDYEDMLLWTTRLLDEHAAVAAEVRDRYRFFTVDEFQDVNPAQWTLLRAWLGDRDELCVVGDDDQTIYSFTGASSAYLIDFVRHFPRARVVTLTRNYRSTPQVLALANRVLRTKPADRRKRLVASAPAGPAPALREFADAEAERAAVVARARALIADGVAPGEIAICYRVNSQSQWYEEALADAGIPYTVRGEQGFFDRPEIRQAVSALRAAAAENPEGHTRGEPPPPAGATAARPPRADRELETVLRERLSWHPRRQPSGAAARERWRNLAQLVEVAALTVQAEPTITITELADDFSARAAAGQEAPGPEGAVTLLTLHRAKGCEFDAVFLVACEEGLLPISHARDDDEIEEERRLLYVGVTRARQHLWLSWARTRPSHTGKPMSRRPSRFLYYLGQGSPGRGGGPPRRSAGRPPGPAGKVDAALAERLRAWRKERADRDGVPAFVVFSDRTLSELAASSPRRVSDLLAVHGFGPAKARRYGAELLDVLADAGKHGSAPPPVA